ncbi:uncharacterized protein LOC144007305 isoform X1 [Festucalex cinctus]
MAATGSVMTLSSDFRAFGTQQHLRIVEAPDRPSRTKRNWTKFCMVDESNGSRKKPNQVMNTNANQTSRASEYGPNVTCCLFFGRRPEGSELTDSRHRRLHEHFRQRRPRH